MSKRLTLVVVLAVAALLTGLLAPAIAEPEAGDANVGTLRGRVLLDGAGLADVEVIVWQADLSWANGECTDAAGRYRIDDVPTGVEIGIRVGPALGFDCANGDFIAPDGKALMWHAYKGVHGNIRAVAEDLVTYIQLVPGETRRIVLRPRRAKGPICRGFKPTMRGTAGDDVLVGTAKSDVLMGLGGTDTLYGKGGLDYLCGGGGTDILAGGAGNDRLIGGKGSDGVSTLLTPVKEAARKVNVWLSGPKVPSYADGILRGQGVDLLWQIESVVGTPFGDRIVGDFRDNVLLGRGGDDFLNGKGHRSGDELQGGDGFDTCINGEIVGSCEA